MLLAAIVHVVRGNVVDVVVFLGVAVLMLVCLRRDLTARPAPWWLARRSGPVALAVVAAAVVSTQPREGVWVQLVLAVVGVLALVLVVRAGRGSPSRSSLSSGRRTGRVWPWPVVVVLGCLVELADFLAQPDPQTDNPDHPTLSSIVDPLLDARPVRAVAVAVWVGLGWLLLRVVVERDRGAR